jgi:hypothetical protein
VPNPFRRKADPRRTGNVSTSPGDRAEDPAWAAFRREAERRGIPYISLSPADAVGTGARWADDRARELVAAGNVAEAIAVYSGEVAVSRRLVSVTEASGAPISPTMARALDLRAAGALTSMGILEAGSGHARPSLSHTTEAVRIYRQLAGDDPSIRAGLALGLRSFALVRAVTRQDLPQAADAIAEAIEILYPLAQRRPDVFRADLAHTYLVGAEILDLLDRRDEAAQMRARARASG